MISSLNTGDLPSTEVNKMMRKMNCNYKLSVAFNQFLSKPFIKINQVA